MHFLAFIFHSFTATDHTVSFNGKGKPQLLKLPEGSENARKAFAVLKEPLPSEGEVQQRSKPQRNLLVQRMAENNFPSIDEAQVNIF